ncbi:hypothetical protein BDR26DRAFT_554926 [Obelidium mucronatum]|nr:hypothetical protein BDR26DRAFT_554926 [Obelidium mucronatum]
MSSLTLLPPVHSGSSTPRLAPRFNPPRKSIDNLKRALSNSFNSRNKGKEAQDIDDLNSTDSLIVVPPVKFVRRASSIDCIAPDDETGNVSLLAKKLTPREKVNMIIRQVSARNKLRMKYKHEQDQIDLEKTLEHIKASDTVFYKNGKEMWSREIQTLDYTHGFSLDLKEADHIAKSIRKDIELNREIIKVNCDVKLKESKVLLYTVMSRKLKEVEKQYDGRIRLVETQLKGKLKKDVSSAQILFETQNKKTITEATEQMKLEAEKTRIIHEKFQDMYRQNNQEYQTLRYKSAKLYLLLKKHNIPGVQEASEHLDAQRMEIVSMVDKLRSEIVKCDDEIRVLQPKIHKLEEQVDLTRQQDSSKRDVVGIINNGTGSKYVKLENQDATPAFMADDVTRKYVKVKLVQDFEQYLLKSTSTIRKEYAELQTQKDNVANKWDTKFKSAETMFDAEKLQKVMKRQQKLLKMVGKLIMTETKKHRQDQYSRCALTGRTIVELLKKEEKEFKAKFAPVLVQLPIFVKEKARLKKLEAERKVAEELATIAAKEAAEAAFIAQQQEQERLLRMKRQATKRAESVLPSGQPLVQRQMSTMMHSNTADDNSSLGSLATQSKERRIY